MSVAKRLIEVYAEQDKAKSGITLATDLQRLLARIEPDLFTPEALDRLYSASNTRNDDGTVRYVDFFNWLCSNDDLGFAQPADLLQRLSVVAYGVLGTQLSSTGVAQKAEEPGPDVAVVDPAGLMFIQNIGPSGAGGASGVLYRWLGIAGDADFPAAVRHAITAPLAAKYQAYGQRKVIHVVGPNFNEVECSEDEAMQQLATAYRNVLSEFAASGVPSLRLLPISGGIFAGPFKPQLPKLTAQAIHYGVGQLDGPAKECVQEAIAAGRLELCIFEAQELAAFQHAFA